MRAKKRFIAIVMIFAIFVLSGCRTTEGGVNVKINSDGSTESVIRIEYDVAINKLSGGGILKNVLDTSKFNIDMHRVEDSYIEEATYTTDKLSRWDLIKMALSSSMMKEKDMSNEAATIHINKDGGVLNNRYNVSIKLKKDYYGEVEGQINSYVTQYGGNSILNQIGSSVKGVIGEIPFDVNISLPFEINESNGIIGADKKSVLWDYTLKDFNADTEMTISFDTPNYVSLISILVIALILIVLAIVFIKRRRKVA